MLLINHKAKDSIRTPKITIPLENNLKQNLNDATAAMTRLVNTTTAFTIKDSIPDLISAIIKEIVFADLRKKIKIN